MLFSIIIPVTKNDKELKNCLNQLFKQSFCDMEVLVCFNGIEPISLPYDIKTIYLKEANVSKARNICLDQAKGKYILFLDADDVFLDNALDVYKQAIGEDWLITNYIRNKHQIVTNKSYILTKEEMLKHKQFRYLHAKVYSNKIIQENQIRFNESIEINEDYLFNLEYLEYVNEIKYIDCDTYQYRLNKQSVSKIADEISAIKRMNYINYLKDTDMSKEYVNSIVRLIWIISLIDNNEFQNKVLDFVNQLNIPAIHTSNIRDNINNLIIHLTQNKHQNISFIICRFMNLFANLIGKGYYK